MTKASDSDEAKSVVHSRKRRQAKHPSRTREARENKSVPVSERTALVMDDDRIVRLVAKTMLVKRFGFKVETAENGETGLSRMKEQTFDVVFSDIDMPETTASPSSA